MGTPGMRYSLQSRDLIADSIETVTQAQWYDANISVVSFCSVLADTVAWLRQEYGLRY
jgi:dihydroxyacid dehydratase/phosphogluconate dehydratase